jgi:hypothetical protein
MEIDKAVLASLDVRTTTIVLYCLQWFSAEPGRYDTLLAILQRRAGFSLRLADFLTTSYCKTHPLLVKVHNTPTLLASDYDRHLSVYNKRSFDAFARRTKLEVSIGGVPVATTVGQLNYFRWFISRGLHTTILELREDIEGDMKLVDRPKAVSTVTMSKGHFNCDF